MHLKSLDDEIEFMDSDMPKGRGSRPADEEAAPGGADDADDQRGDPSEMQHEYTGAVQQEPLHDDEEGRDLTEEEMEYYEEAVRRVRRAENLNYLFWNSV